MTQRHLERWQAAYRAADEFVAKGDDMSAHEQYQICNQIEAELVASPNSLMAVKALIVIATTIMADQTRSGEAEPSYAPLLRAAVTGFTETERKIAARTAPAAQDTREPA